MDLLQFIILGFIQGITEPLPISSSGHLVIFDYFFSMEINSIVFATIVNFGSALAIVLVLSKDIIRLITGFFGYINQKRNKEVVSYQNKIMWSYAWKIVVASIPTLIAGLFVVKIFGDDFGNNITMVGISLLITALLLFSVQGHSNKGTITDDKITWKNAIVIGFFQVIALIPGISRSGATIVGSLQQGLAPNSAFRFSFMLYLPISLATTLFGFYELFTSPSVTSEELIGSLLACVVAFCVTFIAALWFRNVLRSGKLYIFTIYCVVVGSLVLIFS